MTETPRTAAGEDFIEAVSQAVLDPSVAKLLGDDGKAAIVALVSVDALRDAIRDIESEAAQDAARQREELREALLDMMQHHKHHYVQNPLQPSPCDKAQHAADVALLRATEGKQPCPDHRIVGVSPFCPDCGMTA